MVGAWVASLFFEIVFKFTAFRLFDVNLIEELEVKFDNEGENVEVEWK